MFTINSNSKQPIYDPESVQPMRDELIYVGFQEMVTPQIVEEILSQKDDKTSLVMINSVCGCAAGSARPGVSLALQGGIIPDRLLTVFAGQDRDAIDLLREKYLSNFPPSSPSLALIKNSEVIFMIPRHHIEGRSPEEISEDLKLVFEKFCSKHGPSISPEKYSQLIHAKMCGSKIRLN
jgi:putative YphP/YqiW family bacilliredoxin